MLKYTHNLRNFDIWGMLNWAHKITKIMIFNFILPYLFLVSSKFVLETDFVKNYTTADNLKDVLYSSLFSRMSYWTKSRKINRNVNKHVTDILREIESEQNKDEIENLVSPRSSCSYNSNEENLEISDQQETSDNESISLSNDAASFQDNISTDSNSIDHDDIDTECNAPYYLICDSERELDSSTCSDNNDSFQDLLADWAVEFDIPMNALSSLLSLLRPSINNLPKDPRTLFGTKTTYEISDLCGGQYFHFGLKSGIQSILSTEPDILIVDEQIEVQLNMDGLPLFRSSNAQFWPILGRIENVGKGESFIIGLFYGNSKPSNAADYLSALIEEFNGLKIDGLIYMEQMFTVVLTSVICDSPARAFIKNVKQYSGYHGCGKCIQNGVWAGKMTFPEVDDQLRSDSDFEIMLDEDHHKGPSPLVGIVGMVTQFPFDYMHLVCLGVMKRMIMMWLKGSLKFRLGSFVSNQISDSLYSLRHFIPSEFARKPRRLSEVERWKATEYRQFLLYTGPVVLRHFIHDIMYTNFMLLSVSMHILLNSYLVTQYSEYCDQLLKTFVKHFSQLYGNDTIVFNVHGLTHLANDAKNFGSLDNISAFPFDNYLMRKKKWFENLHFHYNR